MITQYAVADLLHIHNQVNELMLHLKNHPRYHLIDQPFHYLIELNKNLYFNNFKKIYLSLFSKYVIGDHHSLLKPLFD